MAKIKKIVTSEVEGRDFSDSYDKNSLTITGEGLVVHHDGVNDGKPLIKPGILFGANNDSGDGYGLGTIKLVPHAPDAIPQDDRYLIIDPTAPNHIHVRAGGIQDGSNAELILGGEKNNVIVNDSSRNVKIHSRAQQQVMAHLNTLSEPGEYLVTTDVVFANSNGWTVEVNGVMYYVGSVTYPAEGLTQIWVPGAQFAGGGVYNFFSPDNINEWTFATDGTLYGTGEEGALVTYGLQSHPNTNQYVFSPDQSVVLNGNLGEFLGSSDDINNQIATIRDIASVFPSPVNWTPEVSGAGFTQTSNPATGTYLKYGTMVVVNIYVPFTNVTDFGTGQYSVTLPLPAKQHADVFAGSIHNTGPTTDHYSLKGHLSSGSSSMTLWYISGSSKDEPFKHNAPITINTTDLFHMHFIYEIQE